MGFIKRLLGLETKPGEPAPLTDERFDEEIAESGLPCFVYCFSLWCSSCQVMGGLLNEVGPDYADQARFFKLDVTKNPATASRLGIKGVPAIFFFRDGKPVESHTGLIPLDPLKEWIEMNISGKERPALQENPTLPNDEPGAADDIIPGSGPLL
ncbi:MAG: thioredoxin [Bacteroidales bacterium]|nr:thioredoxin [Candidatus Latescibacterota bacterium]